MLVDLTPKKILFQIKLIFIFPLPNGEGKNGKVFDLENRRCWGEVRVYKTPTSPPAVRV